jgi:hypothetical protein
VTGIAASPISKHFGIDVGTSIASMFELFKNEDARSFA